MPATANTSRGGAITYHWTQDYSEDNGLDGTSVTATVHTSWSDATWFPGAMLGTAENNGGVIKRFLPHQHVSKRWLYCTQCELQNGIGRITEGYNKSASFDAPGSQTALAAWSVRWTYLGYDLATDAAKTALAGNGKELCRYVSRKSQTSMESLPVPGTSWMWSDTNTKIPEPATILMATKELEYTWHWVPKPYKETTWDGLLGKVNTSTFDGRGRAWGTPPGAANYPSYGAETVFFAAYEASDSVLDPWGNICQHVTFRFLYRDRGWNNFFRPNQGFVAVVARDGSGRKPFTNGDLMTIFD